MPALQVSRTLVVGVVMPCVVCCGRVVCLVLFADEVRFSR